MIFNCSR